MNKLVIEFVRLAIEHGEAVLNGGSKKANRVHAKLSKIIDEIKGEKEDVRQEFYQLRAHESDSVKLWTAVTLLKTFEKRALVVLKEIETKNTSIIGFNAKTTVDVWLKGKLTNQVDWNSPINT